MVGAGTRQTSCCAGLLYQLMCRRAPALGRTVSGILPLSYYCVRGSRICRENRRHCGVNGVVSGHSFTLRALHANAVTVVVVGVIAIAGGFLGGGVGDNGLDGFHGLTPWLVWEQITNCGGQTEMGSSDWNHR